MKPVKLPAPVLLLAALALVSSAIAQVTYVGPNNNANQPGSGTWNTPGNWSTGSVPVSSNTTDLVFTNAASQTNYTATHNIAGTFTLNDLQLGAASSITLSPNAASNRLNFEDNGSDLASITTTGGGTVTINIGFDVGTTNLAVNPGGGNLVIGGTSNSISLGTNKMTFGGASGQITVGARDNTNVGIITGTGSLEINRSGLNANMNGPSTYSGGTVVKAGILVIGTSSVGAGNSVTSGPLGTGTVTVDGTTTIRGAGSTATNNGSYVLGNNVTLNTNVQLGAGNDSVIDLAGTVTLTGNRVITVDHSTGTNTPAKQIISGSIVESGGARSLTVVRGAGTNTTTLELRGSNSFTGTTLVTNNARLNLNATGGGALGGTTNVTLNAGALLIISQSSQINNSAAVTLSGATIQRESGVSEVMGNLTVTADSTLDYVGGTAGSLQFGTYLPGAFKLTLNNFGAGNTLKFGSDLSSFIAASGTGTTYTNSYFSLNGMTASGFTSSWNSGTSTFTITSVPEPSTILAALGLAALMALSSRRRPDRGGDITTTPKDA